MKKFGGVQIGSIALGASGTAAIDWLHGDIAEVLVYDRGFLSEGEQRLVLDYLPCQVEGEDQRKPAGPRTE